MVVRLWGSRAVLQRHPPGRDAAEVGAELPELLGDECQLRREKWSGCLAGAGNPVLEYGHEHG